MNKPLNYINEYEGFPPGAFVLQSTSSNYHKYGFRVARWARKMHQTCGLIIPDVSVLLYTGWNTNWISTITLAHTSRRETRTLQAHSLTVFGIPHWLGFRTQTVCPQISSDPLKPLTAHSTQTTIIQVALQILPLTFCPTARLATISRQEYNLGSRNDKRWKKLRC